MEYTQKDLENDDCVVQCENCGLIFHTDDLDLPDVFPRIICDSCYTTMKQINNKLRNRNDIN